MPRSDLSKAEQANVRVLLRMLHAKMDGRWQTVARALPIASSSLVQTMSGRVDVSVTIAFRVAKLLDVPLQRLLAGEALPPGTCKHRGRTNSM